MSSRFGRCPICTEELQPSQAEDFVLVCPAKDYKVRWASFSARWNRFFAEVKGKSEEESDAMAEALLEDLQEMNTIGVKEHGENNT